MPAAAKVPSMVLVEGTGVINVQHSCFKKRGHGVEGLLDAEDPFFVFPASLVIDSMS